MDIDAMKEGPELDRLVAFDVMQWHLTDDGDAWVSDRTGECLCERKDFRPSTKIADAWMVVEEAFNFSLHSVHEGKRGNWCKWHLAYGSHVRIFEGSGETMPLAICRAALKAVTPTNRA